MNYTPGPWRMQRRDPELALVNGAEFRVGNQTLWVATTCGEVADEDNDLKRQEENARLISAAPELLHQIKKIAALNGYRGFLDPHHAAELDKLIAKATGGRP